MFKDKEKAKRPENELKMKLWRARCMRKLTKARVLSQAETEAMKEEERGRGQKSYGGTVGMATVVDEGIPEMSILKLGFKARLCPFPAPWFGHLRPHISVSDV